MPASAYQCLSVSVCTSVSVRRQGVCVVGADRSQSGGAAGHPAARRPRDRDLDPASSLRARASAGKNSARGACSATAAGCYNGALG